MRDYYKILRKALDALRSGETYNPPRLQHNDISAALLIKLNEAAVILGGDVEAGSWACSLAQLERSGPKDISAHVVKVSHHGSQDAINEEFWQRVSRDGDEKPIAVFMPYTRFNIPSPDAIEDVRRFAEPLLSTWKEPVQEGLWTDLEFAERLALESGPFFEIYAEPMVEVGRWSIIINSHGSTTLASSNPAAMI
jgi:hypothetical protein